ncbi:MAG: hypothetical protein ACHQ06_02855, partial [Candidatus Dormibacteria bacterium]
ATIDWGDGTIASGTVSGCCGAFAVSGSHSYSALGTYTTTTTLGELSLATRVTATGTVSVVTPMTLSATSISGGEGTPISGVVATFSDNLGADPAANYAATITWGDGTSSPGTVASAGGTNYTISASHVYGDEGSYPLTVGVTDTDGYQASGGATATIADAPVSDSFTGQFGISFAAAGDPFQGVVGRFVDTNQSAPAAAMTASINWGDGSAASPGSVNRTASGALRVGGSHTYAHRGVYLVTTTLSLGPASAISRDLVLVFRDQHHEQP